jgi:hypothetical protein
MPTIKTERKRRMMMREDIGSGESNQWDHADDALGGAPDTLF